VSRVIRGLKDLFYDYSFFLGDFHPSGSEAVRNVALFLFGLPGINQIKQFYLIKFFTAMFTSHIAGIELIT